MQTKLVLSGYFATIDEFGNPIKTKSGINRDEAEELLEEINGIEIDSVKFILEKETEIKLTMEPLNEGIKLSEKITSNEPKGFSIPQFRPKKPEAKFTSSVLNKFVSKTYKILSKHPINRNKPKANILILDAEKETGKPEVC